VESCEYSSCSGLDALKQFTPAPFLHREAGITEDQALSDVTGSISFSVAAIIDGSRQMDLDGQLVLPFLAFATERNGDEILAAEGGSWMHEYVFGVVDAVFADDEDE